MRQQLIKARCVYPSSLVGSDFVYCIYTFFRRYPRFYIRHDVTAIYEMIDALPLTIARLGCGVCRWDSVGIAGSLGDFDTFACLNSFYIPFVSSIVVFACMHI